MGGVGVVIIIIYIVIRWSRRDKGVSGDTCPAHNTRAFIVISGVFTGLVLVLKYSESTAAPVIYLIIASIAILPGYFSITTSKLGWVKTSYFLGRISYFHFRRSAFSGGLMRGLQATYQQRSDEARRESLRFLKSKFLRHKGKIYSGEMILAVIIDAFLLHPHDAKYMSRQLKLLDGIGKASIPRCISVYASKLALAPALANNDWDEIIKLTRQWRTPAKNTTTQYLEKVYRVSFKEGGVFTQLSCKYHQLFFFRKPLLVNLPEQLKINEQHSHGALDKKSPVEQLFSVQTLEQNKVAFYREKMLSPQQQAYWKSRAQEIGVWKVDQAWDEIAQSVERCLSQKSQFPGGQSGKNQSPQNTLNQPLDDIQNEQVDKLQKNLHYICQSISRRLESENLAYGVQNYLDWIKIHQILNELKIDKLAFETAFIANHTTLWNWVAELWNNKKERCLAHYISNVCAPIAKECGQGEFYDTLHGIVQGEFK